ncbi:MAG: hypothetical protein WA982_02160 [Rubrobacteraceae bacterium]
MGPLRTGFIYGTIAVVVALLADFRFLYLNPDSVEGWIIALVEQYRTQLALAAYLLLAILAALRTRPTYIHQDVPYKSLILRDATLAATVVAMMVGVALFFITFLQATVFAEAIREYARVSAVEIVAYVEELANRFDSDPPQVTVQEMREILLPPTLADLGRSIFNLVMRGLLLGFTGALVGVLRGRFGTRNQIPEDLKNQEPKK